uniref:O-methyltransferase domain-containing protein n=1 Tax=Ananas comosus var. bracteatus TaxID=296719 RepID=A0A6V7QNY3_ANACO|nr:unnamed protein product [Ananas comosus var. bracteatus]
MMISSNSSIPSIKQDMEGGGVGVEAQATVWSHILSLVDSFVLKCAIKLDIIDIIHRRGRPVPASELAASLPKRRAWCPSRSCRPTRRCWSPCTRWSCAWAGSRVQEGEGGSVWERASRDAAFNELFNRAMACNTALVADGMVEGCRAALAGVRSLVDVGGGRDRRQGHRGGVPAPPLRRVRPAHVVDSMQKRPGLEYVGGDMFASVPHADAVLLKSVLHDWSDEECLRILKRCKEALPGKGGKLIIVDIVVDDEREHEFARARMATDMLMMVYTGGRERTKKEWNQLVLGAGFASCKIKPIMAMEQMIEAST